MRGLLKSQRTESIHGGGGRPGERPAGLGPRAGPNTDKGVDQKRKQLRASLHSEGNGSGGWGGRWMTRAGRFEKAQIWELAGRVDNGEDQRFCEVEA